MSEEDRAVQPVSPLDSDALRPLPRRNNRPSAARVSRPRFGLTDVVWILLITLLAVAVLRETTGFSQSRALGSLAAVGTVITLYLLGWRARDRAAGIIAALLAATSLPFLQSTAYSAQSGSFMLLTVAALFAFVAGSSLAALGLAACATLVRPDGMLLGILLLGLSLAQHRRRAVYGAALFIFPIMMVWTTQTALGHLNLSLPRIGFHSGLLLWLWTPATALLTWFLLPFCAEMSEPMRRARWLPVVLWSGLYLATASFLSFTNPVAMLLPLMPFCFALAGGGLSRMLPPLAGEFPSPALRYLLATLAVLALIGLHVRLEPQIHRLTVNKSAAIVPHNPGDAHGLPGQ